MGKKQAAVEEPVEEPKAKAPKEPKKGKAAQTSTDLPSASEWQDMLDDLGSESNDPRIYFIKQGRNRLRLVPEGGDPRKFYCKVVRNYKGQVSTKFLLRGIVQGREENSVQLIPCGKSVVKNVLNLLAEGYDLLSPNEGLGITIIRAGQGREGTSYNVLPSPKAVPLPKKFTDLEDSMEAIAQEISENDEKRAAEDEGSQRGARGARAAAARLGKGKEADTDEGDW